MQTLYQIDLRGDADLDAIRQALEMAEDGPDNVATRRMGYELAEKAWVGHGLADALTTDLAPSWPTHRQPPVDRAILRLAYYEMSSGYAPYKVVINEAVELAKDFGSQQSPAFINGVLDKMARRLFAEGMGGSGGGAMNPGGTEAAKQAGGDAWLHDALQSPGGEAGKSPAVEDNPGETGGNDGALPAKGE